MRHPETFNVNQHGSASGVDRVLVSGQLTEPKDFETTLRFDSPEADEKTSSQRMIGFCATNSWHQHIGVTHDGCRAAEVTRGSA